MLDLALGLQIECSERGVSPDELMVAEEAFLTGSAIGVMPISAVDNHPVGQGVPGDLCRRIRSAYSRLLFGGLQQPDGHGVPGCE